MLPFKEIYINANTMQDVPFGFRHLHSVVAHTRQTMTQTILTVYAAFMSDCGGIRHQD